MLLPGCEFRLLGIVGVEIGIEINTKITAGAIVQMVSIICPSRMNRLVCLF